MNNHTSRFLVFLLLLLIQPSFYSFRGNAMPDPIHTRLGRYPAFNQCFSVKILDEIFERTNNTPSSDTVAIADLSVSSDRQRFYIVDLISGEVLLQTWVSHGKNSGEDFASRFSNDKDSYKSSKGLYRVGEVFNSPKHGSAILLDGLEPGINDHAREREIILHGADYVGEDFIEQHGRCGRSLGCPALPRKEMSKVIELLRPGTLLYIHG